MTKEIHKYPSNARTEDEIKIFLSDQIFEQVGRITAAIIFAALFGMPMQARPIGVTPRLSSAAEINRPAPQHFYQYAKTVNPRVDKIIMITNNKMIPLIYINGNYSYINEQLLKKLRAGNLASNITVFVISVVVCVMFQSIGVDAFQTIANWNAPQPGPSFFVPGPTSYSFTQLSVIPTKAQEFNDMLLKFNQPKTSYKFVMSDQEAHRKLTEMYPDVLEISPNTHISDFKAAGKIYHASQLGVYPEDYGMRTGDVKRISEIGIYNYAKEGRPLPPIKLIKDYQLAVKNICINGKSLEGTYSSRAEQKIHKAKYKYNVETREVAGFYEETGELITATKYRKLAFEKFIITKSLGNVN